MILFINNNGYFLAVSEVSSHSVKATMGYQWVQDINKASLFDSFEYFGSICWKSGSPSDEIYKSLRAEVQVIRTITLINQKGAM